MAKEAWNRRRMAARPWRPARVRLLLVAEAPPADETRYFYFEEPGSREALFDEVAAVIFEAAPEGAKTPYLKELRRRGVFVVELKPDAPRGDEPLAKYVTPFLLNLEALSPAQIILVGEGTYDAAYREMARAELPVADVRVPSPDSGVAFRQKLRQALVRAGLEKLIRPLQPSR